MRCFYEARTACAAVPLSVAMIAPVSVSATEEPIKELIVVAFPAAPANESYPVERPPAADSADFLRSLPGIDAGRFGGHSLEPVIHGQANTRLTVYNNGALQISAGPNRMDAPATYATIDLIDKVVIVRGYQSVLNGPGAPGGVIRFERNDPEFQTGTFAEGRIGAAYESNADAVRTFGRLRVGSDQLAVNLYGSWHDANNYSDGHGNEVRTAFEDRAIGGSLDWADDGGAFVRLSYDRNRMGDALFPGAGMDSISSKGDTVALRAKMPGSGGLLGEVRMEASYARMRHVMDNFSHRALPAMSGMPAEARTLSATWAAEVEVDLDFRPAPLTLAVDFRNNRRDATRFGGMSPEMLNMTQSVLWPDVRTREYGIAGEQRLPIGGDTELVWGARLDHVNVEFRRADEVPTMMVMGQALSPNALYSAFYGRVAEDVSETHFGGLLRLEHTFSEHLSGHLAASRAIRTADATERGLANRMVMGGMDMSWVGNPGLRPESHWQLESALFWTAGDVSLDLTAWIDRVDDYILRDSARAQDDIIVMLPMADVYRNIDAQLLGLDARVNIQLGNNATLEADVTYTRGQDRDRDGPLAQIPPLQGHVGLSRGFGKVDIRADIAWALRQERADTNPMTGSGRDALQTPGWVRADLSAIWSIAENSRLMVGVRNLFDEQYAHHLSRANLADAVEVQVNEPGRSLYAKLTVSF